VGAALVAANKVGWPVVNIVKRELGGAATAEAATIQIASML
jgi:hypothetical protein